MIVARSFARIHETNLKKQGVLPYVFRLPALLPLGSRLTFESSLCQSSLWFADKADYSKISAGDNVETLGVKALLEGDFTSPIVLRVTKPDGLVVDIPTKHTMSVDQVGWLNAGSALNLVKQVKAAAQQAAL